MSGGAALDAEAAALAAAMKERDAAAAGADPAAAGAESQPGSQSQEPPPHEPAGAPGGEPEPEVLENPAPQIAAALRRALALRKVRAVVPARVLAVFDDETIERFSFALGAVIVKHHGSLGVPAWLEKWKEEAALVWVCFWLWLSVQEALAASTSDAQPGAAGAPPGDPPPKVDGEATPA